jgi:uncharacterized protein YkwD
MGGELFGMAEVLIWRAFRVHITDRTQAINYNSVEQAQKGWMYSNGQRGNLLTGDYCRFGYRTAIDVANGSAYWVRVFATCSS